MVRPGEKAGGRSEGAPGAFPRAGLRNITEPRLKSGPSSNLNEYTESVRPLPPQRGGGELVIITVALAY